MGGPPISSTSQIRNSMYLFWEFLQKKVYLFRNFFKKIWNFFQNGLKSDRKTLKRYILPTLKTTPILEENPLGLYKPKFQTFWSKSGGYKSPPLYKIFSPSVHSFTSCSHLSPVQNLSLHSQWNPVLSLFSEHVPPLWQNESLQRYLLYDRLHYKL